MILHDGQETTLQAGDTLHWHMEDNSIRVFRNDQPLLWSTGEEERSAAFKLPHEFQILARTIGDAVMLSPIIERKDWGATCRFYR